MFTGFALPSLPALFPLSLFLSSLAFFEPGRPGYIQPPPQALRFSHGRGEHQTRVTGDEPQGTMASVSFPPSFARISKERRLGTRQGQADVGRYMVMP